MDTVENTLNNRQRWISLAELLLGAMIVIGHNVYRVLPNEVPILFVIGWVSIKLRNGGWKNIGLRRPDSWWRTVAWALATAAVIVVLSDVLVGPIAEKYLGVEQASKIIGTSTPDRYWALRTLVLIWTFAAFGEEMGYRGYLMTRASDVGNRSRAANVVALIVVSVLFGYGHYYKGPAGIVASTVSGLALGGVYLLSRRNLWISILAHGFRDTVFVVGTMLGWAK